jgi:Protein of unknown function (DUF3048) N-terminal domain/Protein of unknown function (DUF3048) C-terminal domain
MATKRKRCRQTAITTPLVFLILLSLLSPLAGCTASSRAAQDGVEPASEPEKPPMNPLTGEVVASVDLVTRRPLAVKVENDPKARPQSGIVDADLIYEELVEGGVTRFICIYLSKDSQAIGPTRSARPSDIDITFFLNPLLICSGGASQVMSMVQASGMMYIVEDTTHFWRDRKRAAPHNLYTSTDLLRQYLAEEGDTYNALPDGGLYFEDAQDEAEETSSEEAASGEETIQESVMVGPASTINIAYKAAVCAASYQYDAAGDNYLHSIQGAPHTDLTTGARVAPRNVIVQYVTVTNSSLTDVTGSPVPVSQVVGSGKCLIFTAGKVYHATWKKGSRSTPTTYVDENGNPVPLRPGQTWIHLISDDIQVTYQ